mgnify:CR=1 FL=1
MIRRSSRQKKSSLSEAEVDLEARLGGSVEDGRGAGHDGEDVACTVRDSVGVREGVDVGSGEELWEIVLFPGMLAARP